MAVWPSQFWRLLLIILFASIALATVDVNLQEFSYLADRLTQQECRTLVAGLHFDTFEKPDNLDDAVEWFPEDTSCLDLLLHWNHRKGEGYGQYHGTIERRLRQLNRPDLADWLGNTVNYQLSRDAERNYNESFEFVSFSSEQPTTNMHIKTADWTRIDGIFTFIIVLLILCTIYLLCHKVRVRCKRMPDTRIGSYNKINSDSDSGNSAGTMDPALAALGMGTIHAQPTPNED